METAPLDHLSLLRQLAAEYQQRHAELEEALRGTDPDEALRRLKALSESTTDRFRTAQYFLFDILQNETRGAGDQTLKAAAALCRCFDEMRILFQVLLERSARAAE